MVLTFAFEEDLDVILRPEESATFAFAFSLALHRVSPKVTAKLANRFPCEASPVLLGVAVGHVDGHGSLRICHVGDIWLGNLVPSILGGGICVNAIVIIMIGTVDRKCYGTWFSRTTSP